jgi:hypothetical protein
MDRPIPFSGEMVRAILDGRKTQTRRVVKTVWDDHFEEPCQNSKGEWFVCDNRPPDILNAYFLHCPYGQPGDRLWVRESWKISSFMEGDPISFQYKDGTIKEENERAGEFGNNYEEWYEKVIIQSSDYLEKIKHPMDDEGIYHWEHGKSPLPWRPSIFMPRWASRILLEVVSVRVERVKDISENDAYSEGIRHIPKFVNNINFASWSDDVCSYNYPTAKEAFHGLWDSINGKKYPWDANPYVWVIEFKVV